MYIMRKLIAAITVSIITTVAVSAGPARWKIADEDTTILLFGTIHILKNGTNWLDSGLRQDLMNADGLYVELSPEQQVPAIMSPLIQEHGLLKGGATLSQQLDQSTYSELQSVLMKLGIPEAQMASVRPWLVGVSISTAAFAQHGYNPRLSVESVLTGIAKNSNIPIMGLETAEFQISRFSKLSEKTEAEFLKVTLDQISEAGTLLDTLTDTWASGDTDKLATLLQEGFPVEELSEIILYERNANWVTDMENILDKPGTYFVAVGAGHLVGEKSLVDLIEKAGHSVVRY